jgi:hypothetical protein
MHASRHLFTTLLLLALGHAVASAAEPIQYQQNFDGLTLGALSGQNNWYGSATVQNTVAVSGNAMMVGAGGSGERGWTGVPQTFSSLLTHPIHVLSFDLLLPSTINDYSGTPNVDIQETIQFRGPQINQEFFVVYKATTNGSGAVTQNRLEFRSGSTVGSPNTVLPDTWYHVQLLINFDKRTLDGLILNPDGSVFWDPAPLTNFYANGNINYMGFFADNTPAVPLYIDNILVMLPEPAGLGLFALGTGLLLRRRRHLLAGQRAALP